MDHKKTLTALALTLSILLPVVAGALDGAGPEPDDEATTRAMLQGPQETPLGPEDLATGLSHVKNVDVGDMRGIRARGDHVYASGHHGFSVFDISSGADPVRVGYVYCPGRDVAVSGSWAVIVIEGGSCAGRTGGVRLVDISDPTDPTLSTWFGITRHTIAAIGESGIFHSASQELQPFKVSLTNPGYQDIIDTSQGSPRLTRFLFPTAAENLDPVNAPSCHEFYYDEATARGYCAGIVETHIWDMADPLAPRILSVIKNPIISIHHSARPAHGGDLVIINDEEAGALVPSCYQGTMGRAPRGALWFYDTSDEARPVLKSWVNVPTPATPVTVKLRCTSHYGDILPNDDQAVWGWYGGAIVLIDFQDILLPQVLDSFDVPNGDTWGALYHDNGYVYGGDMNRGLDVYSVTT